LMAVGAMGAVWGAETGTATKPAATTTKAALPECCKEQCQKMVNCCTTDGAGKTTCAMGGSCCNK
jgi:hypothetical protein